MHFVLGPHPVVLRLSPGSVLMDPFCWGLEDLKWCWESNLGWLPASAIVPALDLNLFFTLNYEVPFHCTAHPFFAFPWFLHACFHQVSVYMLVETTVVRKIISTEQYLITFVSLHSGPNPAPHLCMAPLSQILDPWTRFLLLNILSGQLFSLSFTSNFVLFSCHYLPLMRSRLLVSFL